MSGAAVREVTIEHGEGTVRGRLVGTGATGIVLAHGAGAGHDHPWMVTMRDGLGSAGFTVMTFNYAYTEAGRKSPDRLPRLLRVHRAAADLLAGHCDTVVLAGKSMGGRVGSHLAGDEAWPAAALVYFGYPLVALGKSEPRSTTHLRSISAPQLFWAGSRDRLGPPELISSVAAGVPDGTMEVVTDGDHSFTVLKRTARTQGEVMADIVARTAAFIMTRLGSP